MFVGVFLSSSMIFIDFLIFFFYILESKIDRRGVDKKKKYLLKRLSKQIYDFKNISFYNFIYIYVTLITRLYAYISPFICYT